MKIILNITLGDDDNHVLNIQMHEEIPVNLALNALDSARTNLIKSVAQFAHSKGTGDFDNVDSFSEFCANYTIADLKDDTHE